MNKIAVIGPGSRALAIWRLLAGGGYHTVLADGKQPPLPYEAATGSQLVVIAADAGELDDVVAKLGRLMSQTIVVDATEGAVPGGAAFTALRLSHLLDTHRVVRASIPLPQPSATVFLSGDDPDAVSAVEEIFRTAGCAARTEGTLATLATGAMPVHRSA